MSAVELNRLLWEEENPSELWSSDGASMNSLASALFVQVVQRVLPRVEERDHPSSQHRTCLASNLLVGPSSVPEPHQLSNRTKSIIVSHINSVQAPRDIPVMSTLCSTYSSVLIGDAISTTDTGAGVGRLCRWFTWCRVSPLAGVEFFQATSWEGCKDGAVVDVACAPGNGA